MAQRTFPQFVAEVWGALTNRAQRRAHERGFDAASWRRFPKEARSGRMANETLTAAPAIRNRARYYYGSDPHAKAGVDALVVYGWGAGAMADHANADAFEEWGATCDADGALTFDGMFGAALREMIVAGECLILFIVDSDGLKLRLLPAEQLDESLSRDIGNGARIDAGVETDTRGRVVAYWIKPSLPTTQFESYAPPIRFDAADVVHLRRVDFVGQVRGLSWLHAVLLKLADLGLLSDALLKGYQVAALHAGFLEDQNGAASLPFDGDKEGDALEVALEPGVIRRLPTGYKVSFNNPQAAQQSIEFLNAQVNAISAGLGVCAHMVSGDVSRCNYSSLRADLLKMKASVEAWQYSTLVPALNAIWRKWALVESLRNAGDVTSLPTWRFEAFPDADPIKQVQASKLLLETKLASRAELIAARGESIDRVDADIAADPHAQTQTEENGDDAEEEEDSNAE